MRFRLVRPTVGNLIFAVAIVALNCRLYRVLEENSGPRFDSNLWRLPPGFLAGFLPIINVSLIGSWFVVKRWIGRRQVDSRSTPESNPPAITFFCLHFLIVGYLAFNFLDASVGEFRPISLIWDWSFEGFRFLEKWVEISSPVREFGETFCLALGISGPLLILAWFGRLIARRCASRMSKGRFLVMSGLISSGFAIVALSILATPHAFEDLSNSEVVVRVVDQKTGKPIDRAVVRIANPFDWRAGEEKASGPQPMTVTSGDGLARLTHGFEVTGERSAFWTIAVFSTWGRWLEISADGFQTVQIPLTCVLGPAVAIDVTRCQDVALAEGTTPEDSFPDLAGSYQTTPNGFVDRELDIQPDGRFSWSYWSCTQHQMEFGTVQRVGDEIELVPVAKPGEPSAWSMALRYKLIRWGDCLYLTSTDPESIREFCAGGLTPDWKRRPSDSYGGYLIESDTKKVPLGLPPLPLRAWIEFVAFETNIQNQDGSLRRALDSILTRISRGNRDAS